MVRGVLEPPLGCSTRYNFKTNEILTFKENEKKKKTSHSISRVTYVED